VKESLLKAFFHQTRKKEAKEDTHFKK